MSIDDYEDIIPQIVARYVTRAKTGDFRAASRLQELYSILTAQECPPELTDYMKACAARAGEGVPADEAYNLKRQRGRHGGLPSESKRERDVEMAIRVDEYRHETTYEVAVSMVAQEFHVSPRSVEYAYQAHGDPLRSQDAFEAFKRSCLRDRK